MDKWNKKEDAFLRKFYTRTSNKVLAYVLGTSSERIRSHARRMGLRSYRFAKLNSHKSFSLVSDSYYNLNPDRYRSKFVG